MPSFEGKFQLTGGRAPLAGACLLTFDEETLRLVAGGQPVLACDLGDIDVFAPGDHVLDLTLFTGQRLRLQQFGKPFDTLAHDLLEAYRARLVKCLLLEDLEEVSRFTGTLRADDAGKLFSAPAEIRIYRSNVAFLPDSARGFQWRLADVEGIEFDASTYCTTLRAGGRAASVRGLAKRTEEFRERLQAGIDEVGQRTAAVLHALVPFITPTRFGEVAGLMREGHPAPLVALDAIDQRISQGIVTSVVDATLRPYYDALLSLATKNGTFTGFKIIRPEAEDLGAAAPGGAATENETSATVADIGAAGDGAEGGTGRPDAGRAEEEGAGEEQEPVLHWFFFRIAPPAVTEPMLAWEATSRSGRATYLFRESVLGADGKAPSSPQDAVDRLGAGLALVNFRREPIYLPDASLDMQERYRRYAIAARRLPELRALRAAFAGRAIHSSLDAWRRQLDGLLRPR
jgi:hypothetical protein